MKKRSTEILQRLLSAPGEKVSVQQLLDHYLISEKTLRNDVAEISAFLSTEKGEEAIVTDGAVLQLKDRENTAELRRRIADMDLYDYKLSLEERKFYISLVLLFQEGYHSMQQFADELYVTRNTIVNDCKVVESFLQEYHITYTARSKKGICISATQAQREQLLVDIFCALIPTVTQENSFFVQFLMKKFGFVHRVSDITAQMTRFTGEHSIVFAGEVFYEIAICLFVAFNCMQKQPDQHDTVGLELDTIGEMVRYVAEQMECSLSCGEVIAIEKSILMRDLKPEIQSISDFELYGVISHFLLEVGREIDIDIQNDDLLIKALLSHIKNMRNWGGVELDLSAELADIGLLSRVQQSAADKFYILEQYLRYQMDDNMRASIIIHICAALYRTQENMTPCRVIVSCPGSMATSRYLEAQVHNYFNFDIVGTMTTRQILAQQQELPQVDFIISTVAVPDCLLPVIVVSPLLTVEDINKIQIAALKKSRNQFHHSVDTYPLLSRLHAVYSTGNSRKIAYLDRELQRVLEEVFRIESEAAKQSALLQMLQLKYVKLFDGALEWREAMQAASADLIRDGYFDHSYVEKAIENVEEYGSYIIVNQGIALAHASRDAGVYEDGISLLVAKDGITFEDGETVYLMFFFSQKGETDYLDLFKEIIKLGNDQRNIEKMRHMESSQTVYQLIVEILTEYEKPTV
ncbi:MAG: PTS sugar transporter subunit IIA [Butyricicoccus sp.]